MIMIPIFIDFMMFKDKPNPFPIIALVCIWFYRYLLPFIMKFRQIEEATRGLLVIKFIKEKTETNK
jgi:phosphotransferase system  glucose/maltose/N-acetylglucosamine-specific IIC component